MEYNFYLKKLKELNLVNHVVNNAPQEQNIFFQEPKENYFKEKKQKRNDEMYLKNL